MLLPKNSVPFEGLYYSNELSTGSTQEYPSLHSWDVENQIKQTKKMITTNNS